MKAGLVFFAFACLSQAQTWQLQTTGVKASLRGLHAVSAQVVWASGTSGMWVRTIDSGRHWQAGIVAGAEKLDFRGIQAFDATNAIAMTSGTGDQSRIYATHDGGATWSLLSTNPDPTGFFDAIAFRDRTHGVIYGDPVNGKLTVFATADGGRHWTKLDTPAANPGEGAFAASNSCLRLDGKNIWLATGGPTGARVIHSPDDGRTWTVAQTPVRHDSESSGIFSLAFAAPHRAIAAGGEYRKDTEARENAASTSDGVTWQALPAGGAPHGYRSAVAYDTKHRRWVATGTSGSDISLNDGATWKLFDSGAFHALSVSPAGAIWASGPDGRLALLVP